jgi:hypothetical protein
VHNFDCVPRLSLLTVLKLATALREIDALPLSSAQRAAHLFGPPLLRPELPTLADSVEPPAHLRRKYGENSGLGTVLLLLPGSHAGDDAGGASDGGVGGWVGACHGRATADEGSKHARPQRARCELVSGQALEAILFHPRMALDHLSENYVRLSAELAGARYSSVDPELLRREAAVSLALAPATVRGRA